MPYGSFSTCLPHSSCLSARRQVQDKQLSICSCSLCSWGSTLPSSASAPLVIASTSCPAHAGPRFRSFWASCFTVKEILVCPETEASGPSPLLYTYAIDTSASHTWCLLVHPKHHFSTHIHLHPQVHKAICTTTCRLMPASPE